MIKIGLTGNIAAGKSEAEKILVNSGFICIDLDIVSHDLLKNNKIIQKQIIENFSVLDRAMLAKIVFSDNKKREILQNIMFPFLKEHILEEFEKNKDKKIIFISGALIYEANFENLFDDIIFIDCDKNIRLNRLMKRNNLTEEDAMKRINAQNDLYKNKARYIIKNEGNFEQLKSQLKDVVSSILNSENAQ